MKKILSRFRNLGRHQSVWIGLFILSFFFVEPAFAQANTPTDANAALLGLGSILAVVVNILTFLVLLIMSWGGDLIGTTFITGPEAMKSIYPMWVFIRNLVNISFVLVLMFLAFANLFSSLSGGQGSWTIKDKLPRIIIALIAVNFSLLIFRVAIDAVHVGTITILSISDTVMEEKAAYNPTAILNAGINNTTYARCSPVETDTSILPSSGGGKCLPFYRYVENALCSNEDADDSDCLIRFSADVRANEQSGLVQASSSTEQNIFWAFGTYFQKLELLPMLAGDLRSLSGVISSTFFSAIMAIMYAVAWVAIFIALAIRVLMLWLFMIMSPALVAAQIMGISGGGEFNIQQRLVTNLIMPLKIAAAFALSFVMISAMIEVSAEMQTGIFEPGRALQSFWGVTTSPFGIMWQIMTVVVFWMAVWWALSGSEAEFINNGIKSGAEQIGKYTGNFALDRVRIPGIGSDGMSVRSLGSLGSVLQADEQSRTRQNREDLGGLLGLDTAASEAADALRAFSATRSNIEAGEAANSGVYTGQAILGLGSARAIAGELEKLSIGARNSLANRVGLAAGASPADIASQLNTMTAPNIDRSIREAWGSGRNNESGSTSVTINVPNDGNITIGDTGYNPSNQYDSLITALTEARRTNPEVLTPALAGQIAGRVGRGKTGDDILSETNPNRNNQEAESEEDEEDEAPNEE